jgi:predicted membrane protein
MGLLTSNIFWGTVVVIFGISILLKTIFHIDLPVFRILLGLFIIYIGVRMLAGWNNGFSASKSAVFSETKINAAGQKGDYSVVFGKGTVDLTGIDVKEKSVKTDVHTVFGETTLIVDQAIPMKIVIDAVFAGAVTPDGNTVSMGTVTYKTKAYREGATSLDIKADVVFGAMKIINK